MEAYTGFAEVYDLFMDNVPYEEWSRYLIDLLREFRAEQGIVLELGCGTGKMTRLLARAGYDMIGIDNSQEMLQIAQEHTYLSGGEMQQPIQENTHISSGEMQQSIQENTHISSGEMQQPIQENTHISSGEMQQPASDILYLLQDMREFELYGTVRAIVSVCDSMNYILEEEELLQVFRLANNYLDPGGVFIFDLNTPYKYREILGENVICENRPQASFIWENYYDEETQVNQYDLTLFVQEPASHESSKAVEGDEGDGGIESHGAMEGGEHALYRKYEETHFQRAYDMAQVKRLLGQAGMEFVAAYDALSHQPPREDSERIYVIAREHGKEDTAEKGTGYDYNSKVP